MPLLNASYLLSTLAWTRRFIGSFTVLQKPLKGLKGNKPKGKICLKKIKNKMRKIIQRKKTASPGAELRPSVQNVNSSRPLLHAANF